MELILAYFAVLGFCFLGLPRLVSTEWEFRIMRAALTPILTSTFLFDKGFSIYEKTVMIPIMVIVLWITFTMAIKLAVTQKEENILLDQLKLPFERK